MKSQTFFGAFPNFFEKVFETIFRGLKTLSRTLATSFRLMLDY